MITTEHYYLTRFICADNKEFDYYTEDNFTEQPPQEVLEYEAALNNTPDKTYNHGFIKGDIAYYCENWKLYQVTITKVTQEVHSAWVEIETDKWHFNEPVKLDVVYFIHPIDGEEVKVDGNNIRTQLKKTVEEFIAN